MKWKTVVWMVLTLLLTAVSTSLFRCASASWVILAVPNGSFEVGTLCTVPDQWEMKTWDRDGVEPVPGATYMHEVCENDTHCFSGSRSCWLHSRVVDTDGTKTSRYSWTWIESEDWISQPDATYLRFCVRDIQHSHSLPWGWNCGIYIGFNDTDTHHEYNYVIYNNGEYLNFNYYNETGIGADGATWYEYIYPIPADIDPSQMRLKIYCVAGDWTFYDPSYFADMSFCVDNVELLMRATSEQCDWPMLGCDSACTSYSPLTAPGTNATAWITDLPGGTVWACPLVAEGRVFIGAGGYFNAWNETDGSFLWRFSALGQPGYPITAAAAGGMVFFGTAEPGPGGCIYALNATTGQQTWTFATEGYLRGASIVEENRLYFGGDLGSEQGKIFCINAATGASIWNYTTQDRMSSVAVAYGRVYACCGHWETLTQAAVYCLDMYDGGLVWSFDTGRDICGVCAVANGRVYFSASNEGWDCAVFALNATNGNVVWSTTRYSDGQAGRGAVAYGKFFIILGYGASGVYALNETNGDEIWASPGPSGGGPVVADGKVFFARGDPANVFYAVDETTGAAVWSYKLGGWVHSATSAIARGRVFVADHYDEKLYAFGLPVYNVNTGLDYATIQQAIDAPETLDGHTIRVAVGTYFEHVTVTKSLFLIGENRSTTIIDGRLTGTVVTVEASNVKITGFTMQNSAPSPDCGIHVDELSDGTRIVQNIIADDGVGVLLDGSSNNEISENIIANNELGIRIYRSSDNSIFHNNFIDNTNQAYIDPAYPSTNAWDDSSRFGWRLEGNYWSDCDGKDECHGRNQDEAGYDWIWDAPYSIDADNLDNYPLTDKWWVGRVADVDHNGVVNIIDISVAAAAFGSMPGDPRWNYKADTYHDGAANILDIALVARCYLKEDP